MAKRIVVDPITRIEGHLRIEAQLNRDNHIEEAYSAGTMFRGLEVILQGRDPRDAWAFTQRICGVCTTVHALSSIRAVEDAVGIEVPRNAEIIRNLMNATQQTQDHLVHFYHLHALDWVDIISALKADPKATSELAQSISDWPKSSPGYFKDMQNKLKKFAESGQLGIFSNGYWGHPAYKLPPEANLMAVCHYLEALEFQKEIVKIHTVFGGKNPHPNYTVGGMACAIDLNSEDAINIERLNMVKGIIDDTIQFIDQVYIPDLLAIASFYKDWTYGGGLGSYMAYGDFPTTSINDVDSYLWPRGAILDKDLSEIHPVDPKDINQIQETAAHSFYKYDGDKNAFHHPYNGVTDPEYTGPELPYDQLDVENDYSWLKTPRYNGQPVEVGPLARVLLAYANGNEEIVSLVDYGLTELDLPLEAAFSTLGRTFARGIECRQTAGFMARFYDDLIANIKAGDTQTFNDTKWEPEDWPAEAQGCGTTEAPRGALGHWVTIADGKIDNYQIVVPSTWNASPRDGNNQRGAYEAALIGTPVIDSDQPVEILRTIHSFDPCLACATHLIDVNGEEITKVTVN